MIKTSNSLHNGDTVVLGYGSLDVYQKSIVYPRDWRANIIASETAGEASSSQRISVQ